MSSLSAYAHTVHLLQMQQRIADAAAVEEVEGCPRSTDASGLHWYDTRPLLDPREHCSEAIDMAATAIAYAQQRGLVVQQPGQPHLLRIAQPGALQGGPFG